MTAPSTRPLLAIDDLSVAYGRGAVPAVRGVSLTVRPGEVVALVGESGSGKSTTAHAVLGLLPTSAVTAGGSVTFDGDRLDGAGERAMTAIRGRRIGFVPQDPGTSLNPVHTVGEQIAEVLRVHRLADRRAARVRAVEILERAGIDDPALRARQYPHQLSGGQRQRVLIGIATACSPQLVVADEPTSALDVTVQRRILDHLAEMTRAIGSAVLLITHDLAVASDRADRVVVMRGGAVVEQGPTREILASPRHDYTRRLLAAAPGIGAHRHLSVHRPALPAGGPVLRLAGIHKTFDLGRGIRLPAVRGIDLEVPRGGTLAVVGESGSGKSTTARIAMRLEQPDRGSVEFDGRPITLLRGTALRALRRRIQIVQQNPYASLDPRMTIGAIIAEPLRAFGLGERASRARVVHDLAASVALDPEHLDRRPAELSGGQRQRVAIARALAPGPDLLVLDEPVSALDVSVQARILELLERLQRERGLSYLFITHDLAVARRIADRVAVMRAGVVVEHGPAAEVFDHPTDDYTRALLDAIPGKAFDHAVHS
ncbi:ABC transporter ATP-binding protein [Raineyella sp. W15-4]|uniref:ABC transporter ATP-binding protein n=1 Tax=Raineyella sp. W15-4 TaxID=3081651 RepID=UPI002953E6D3|nr:ABC transporter ATP-binding protein [Raineyella sp. W15-4]WOQ18528.1 ABC transporter ATP-binding protein [Raineyella sp. W15-4]